MTKIKTIIVDDEPLARKGLAVRLEEYTDIEVVKLCSSGSDAIAACKEHPIDLVFLDIQMPGMNGFEVARALSESTKALPAIVFVTAFDQFAVKAFEIHALDYILKPVDDNRLKQAVEKVHSYLKTQQDNAHKKKLASFVAGITGNNCEEILKKLATGDTLTDKRYPESLAVKEQGEIIRVPVATIQWVDAAGDYMCLHCQDGQTHILRKTMKELEQELEGVNAEKDRVDHGKVPCRGKPDLPRGLQRDNERVEDNDCKDHRLERRRRHNSVAEPSP